MLFRFFFLNLTCLLALGLPADAARWTDAVNRSVEIPDTPRRIVSLAPSVTEILFALGLGERIEGVTRFCNYPPEAAAKPQIGGYTDPSLEAIAARNPDLVLVSADAATPALLSRIEALGTAAYVVYPRDIEQTIATIRSLGQVTGAAIAGERIAEKLTADISRVRQAVSDRQRPRVLFCVMLQPFTVAGPGTLVDDLITTAGGINVVEASPSRYPTWNAEALLVADPDLIVFSPHPDSTDANDFFRSWPALSAVKNQRIYTIEPDLVHRPGPRLAIGLAALARAFHGIEVPISTPGPLP